MDDNGTQITPEPPQMPPESQPAAPEPPAAPYVPPQDVDGGATIPPPPPAPPGPYIAPPGTGGASVPPYPAGMAYSTSPQPLGAPGIAVAGFVMVLVGLFIPIVGLIGFILSWVGLSQAKREGRPRGLALAGTIIGAVATILGIILIIIYLGLAASGS
jgi:hypothetical protein